VLRLAAFSLAYEAGRRGRYSRNPAHGRPPHVPIPGPSSAPADALTEHADGAILLALNLEDLLLLARARRLEQVALCA
jgi:hypothetical protein